VDAPSVPTETELRGFVDIDCNSLFRVTDCESVHITRGHNLRLCKQHCNLNCRLNAFVYSNINVWNQLPAHVVNSDSVAVFLSEDWHV